jgi:hypothetical protein
MGWQLKDIRGALCWGELLHTTTLISDYGDYRKFIVFHEITIIAIIASFFREKLLSFGVIFSRKTKQNDYHYQP